MGKTQKTAQVYLKEPIRLDRHTELLSIACLPDTITGFDKDNPNAKIVEFIGIDGAHWRIERANVAGIKTNV